MRGVTVKLRLLDNRSGDPSQGGHGARIAETLGNNRGRLHDVIRLLAPFQNRTLRDWETLGLTVYSAQRKRLVVENDEALEQLSVFTLGGIDNPDSAWINTHNCMGVVRLHDKASGTSVQLEIASRFDDEDKQYFLNYLLSKVFGGSLADEVEVGGDSFWEMLLAFVFRHRLLEASKVGLFKQYRRRQRNDLRLRGQINFDAHLRQNVPFCGRIAYISHEITLDNPINHLIRHAMTKIRRKWQGVLSGAREIADLGHQFEQHTPSWHKGHILGCLKENQRPIRHPYFHGHYEPLRKIALGILRSDGAGLFDSADEAEGVLFDGSWLWESYIWSLLQPLGFQHTDNRKKTGRWDVLGTSFYPDFFLVGPNHSEPRIVLDAKYKRAGRSTDDIRQVLAYMFMLNAQHGGLIKPESSDTISDSRPTPIEWRNETRGKWHDLSLRIPRGATSAREFRARMQQSEQLFASSLSVMQFLPERATSSQCVSG